MHWIWFGAGLFVGVNMALILLGMLFTGSREVLPPACRTCPENPANYGDKVAA
jgi:hypothetical protein